MSSFERNIIRWVKGVLKPTAIIVHNQFESVITMYIALFDVHYLNFLTNHKMQCDNLRNKKKPYF